MATILEGLNKLSGALGGAETATENLEALNAIAGALGGETNATNNADAIDQIAEHASGGGGSSDFTTATITSTNEGTIDQGPFLDENQGIEYISTRKTVRPGEPLECVLYKGNAVLFMNSLTPVVSFTGSATALQEGELYLVTGDCEFTFDSIQ